MTCYRSFLLSDYLHHGDCWVNLWRERNVNLVLVSINPENNNLKMGITKPEKYIIDIEDHTWVLGDFSSRVQLNISQVSIKRNFISLSTQPCIILLYSQTSYKLTPSGPKSVHLKEVAFVCSWDQD